MLSKICCFIGISSVLLSCIALKKNRMEKYINMSNELCVKCDLANSLNRADTTFVLNDATCNFKLGKIHTIGTETAIKGRETWYYYSDIELQKVPNRIIYYNKNEKDSVLFYRSTMVNESW